MKRKFIALAMAGCFVTAYAHAQLQKGSLLFGGSVGFSSSKRSAGFYNNWDLDTKTTSISLSPSVAIAVAGNLFVGADLIFSNSKDKYSAAPPQSWQKYNSNSYGGGVFVRKYWSIVDKLYIFGQGRLGYEQYKRDVQPYFNPGSYYKGFSVQASLYPGISYAISKKVHLESTFFNLISVAYSRDREYNKPTDAKIQTVKSFSVRSSFDNATVLSVGVKVLLSK